MKTGKNQKLLPLLSQTYVFLNKQPCSAPASTANADTPGKSGTNCGGGAEGGPPPGAPPDPGPPGGRGGGKADPGPPGGGGGGGKADPGPPKFPPPGPW